MVFIISAIQVFKWAQPLCIYSPLLGRFEYNLQLRVSAEGKQIHRINRNLIIILSCIVCILFVFYFANGYLNEYV